MSLFPRRRLLFPLIAVVAVVGPPLARGDEIRLNNGGRIEGTWVNADEPSPSHYDIKTPLGVRMRLAATDVVEVVRVKKELAEYRRRAPRCGDNIGEHWKLAEWCRTHGLTEHRRKHLERILALDTNHVRARRALGYSQVRGKWVTQKQHFQEQGYQVHAGRWLSQQEIEILKQQKQSDVAQRQWLGKMRRWREHLQSDRAAWAVRQFQSVRDPRAVYGLTRLWKDERHRPPKLLYVEALGRIKSMSALTTLVKISLLDPDEEVYHASLKEVVKHKYPEVVDVYEKALRSSVNVQVNRAGAALGQLRDPTTLSPMIDALVTTHPLIMSSGASKDTMTTTFASSSVPGGGVSPFGGGFEGTSLNAGDDTKVFLRRIRNQHVLDALVSMTGQSFGFNQRAWRSWLDNHNRRSRIETLRQ